MYKQRLFTPGPTPVPEEVLLELARPMFHHRTAEYRAMLEQVTKGMQYVLGTSQDVYTITGSGSAAMEAAVSNVVAPGETVVWKTTTTNRGSVIQKGEAAADADGLLVLKGVQFPNTGAWLTITKKP